MLGTSGPVTHCHWPSDTVTCQKSGILSNSAVRTSNCVFLLSYR